MRSQGIGKLLLDFVKNRKAKLSLNVYQKNIRAIHFYQREGFAIRCEGLDEATGENEYVMNVGKFSITRDDGGVLWYLFLLFFHINVR